MEANAKRRGRPRQYDPLLALAKAREAFWRAGYEATSLDDLSRAMAMKRPSLYGAFGDKEALYLKVLEDYAVASLSALEAQLAAPAPLRESLARAYAAASASYLQGKEGARGCFLISTGTPQAATNPRVRRLLTQSFEDFDRAFERRFRAAVERGELPRTAEPASLGRLATSILHGLALRARGGASRAALGQLAASGVQMICGKR